MKKTVQKFIGDIIREALECGSPSSGVIEISRTNNQLLLSITTLFKKLI